MGLFIQDPTGTDIRRESIRARVEYAGRTWDTPWVKSFNVNLTREQLSNTCSVSVMVRKEDLPGADSFTPPSSTDIEGLNVGAIKVYVAYSESGVPSNFKQLFTGYVRQLNVRRAFSHPNAYILDISANDIMYKLENRNYSRRVTSPGLGTFAVITGVVRKGFGGYHSLKTSAYQRRGSGRSNIQVIDTQAPGRPSIDGNIARFASMKANFGKPSSLGDRGGTTSSDELVISPSMQVMAPGQIIDFICATGCSDNSSPSCDDAYTWSVDTVAAGGIWDGSTALATFDHCTPTAEGVSYKHAAFMNNVLRLTENSTGRTGDAMILTTSVHDHSTLGEGGPAFGVYATIDD